MITIGMSTSCVYPLGVEDAFKAAAESGYEGVEVMVSREETSQSADALLALSSKYGQPILSVHAPVLLLTHFVWGRDPEQKLFKSAELAARTGASTVVVHPPFRWQSDYADEFLTIVERIAGETGVEIAVENMFPWRIKKRSLKAYKPSWNPLKFECDAVTLDFSHSALSGLDSLHAARELGPRLRHVHLCDGHGSKHKDRVFDEHLVPGQGSEPVAEVLRYLADSGWNGSVVAEVNTRKAKTPEARKALLDETIAFFRTHTAPTSTPAS